MAFVRHGKTMVVVKPFFVKIRDAMIKKPSDMELTLAQGLFDNITRNVSLVAIEHMFKKLERGVGPNSISEGFFIIASLCNPSNWSYFMHEYFINCSTKALKSILLLSIYFFIKKKKN